MTYETVESRHVPGEWHVEAINFGGDGEIYGAMFYGPDAEKRAREYHRWKSALEAGSEAHRRVQS